jgi:hypothetical protein
MRVETSKIVYDNCRPGAPVVSVLEEKAAKQEQRDPVASTKTLMSTGELDTSQTEFHKYVSFYSPALLKRPEFVYQNQAQNLRTADVELLEQALKI